MDQLMQDVFHSLNLAPFSLATVTSAPAAPMRFKSKSTAVFQVALHSTLATRCWIRRAADSTRPIRALVERPITSSSLKTISLATRLFRGTASSATALSTFRLERVESLARTHRDGLR